MPANSRVVVIGASAGGPAALRRLLSRLPASFPAPVLVTMHVGSFNTDLPNILGRETKLPVRHAADGDPIQPGTVLMAAPDRHLLVADGVVRLSRGPKENFSRPAIDPMFRTAAFSCKERAVGIILSGMLDDGTVGLQAIKAYGGVALVQDPADAEESSMPRSALEHVDIDACLRVEALADHLVEIAATAPGPAVPGALARTIEVEARFDLLQNTAMEALAEIAAPSALTCPECSGSLWEVKEGSPPHFRCHTGHVYTVQGLAAAQDGNVEEAIWAAVRALHEKQLLLQRLAKSAAAANRHSTVDEHAASAENAARHAEILRRIVAK